jgi:hypothetical protein
VLLEHVEQDDCELHTEYGVFCDDSVKAMKLAGDPHLTSDEKCRARGTQGAGLLLPLLFRNSMHNRSNYQRRVIAYYSQPH